MAASDLPVRVRIESWLVLPVAALVLATGTSVVGGVAGDEAAAGWLAVAGTVATGVVGFLLYHRAAARATANAPPLGSLGVANGITVLRGLASACAAGFLVLVPVESASLLSPLRVGTLDGSTLLLWAPAVLYGGGAALDLVDGAVARRIGRTSLLGERLDLGYDTLGFVVAPAVGVAWGRLPAAYLALSAARYCYRLGIAIERSRGRRIGPLPDSSLRRPLAATQMAFLSLGLVPLFPATLTRAVAPFVLAPSLLVFLRDFLAVTGRLPPQLPGGSRESTTDPTAPEEPPADVRSDD